MPNCLPQLRTLGLSDQEIFGALTSVFKTAAWKPANSVTLKEYVYTSEADAVVARLRLNRKFELCEVEIESALWPDVEREIREGLESETAAVFRNVVYTTHDLHGVVTVPGWIQLRPVRATLRHASNVASLSGVTGLRVPGVPCPVLLEVQYKKSPLAFLDVCRRSHARVQAMAILNAVLVRPIVDVQHPFAWANTLEGPLLVQCGVSDTLAEDSDQLFSDISGVPPLIGVEHSKYYAELGIQSADFEVPDLIALWSKYSKLSASAKIRFLRACVPMWSASQHGNHFGQLASQTCIALVSAIEPLLDEGDHCQQCNQVVETKRRFLAFIDQFVQPTPEIRGFFNRLYDLRSNIAHGRWRYETDESMFGPNLHSQYMPLIAWMSAKRGLANWITAQ